MVKVLLVSVRLAKPGNSCMTVNPLWAQLRFFGLARGPGRWSVPVRAARPTGRATPRARTCASRTWPGAGPAGRARAVLVVAWMFHSRSTSSGAQQPATAQLREIARQHIISQNRGKAKKRRSGGGVRMANQSRKRDDFVAPNGKAKSH